MKQYTDISLMKQFPLSPKKPFKKTLLNGIGILLPLIVIIAFIPIIPEIYNAFIAWWLLESIVIILSFIAIAVIYLYERAYYQSYYYNVADDHLIIKKGVFGIHEVTIPLERIQDVYIDQDPFDYVFGLYDVHFSSATALSGQQAHIDGVDKETAQELREYILARVRQYLSKKNL